MRNWHSLYEILEFPIGVLFLAVFLLGLGNAITNPAFSSLYVIDSDFVLLLAQVFMKTGAVIIVNFPLLFLIRLVARKNGSACSILSAVSGYIAFLVTTMYFAKDSLPGSAYSSILGISMMSTGDAMTKGSIHYPLQTGLIATAIVTFITLICYARTRTRSEYSFFGFMSKDVSSVAKTIIYSVLAGLLVAWSWTYVIKGISSIIAFISNDTTNPVNLALYGIMERILTIFNLPTLIRSPFWYGTNGGTWISMAGLNIAGDVNIWTTQFANNMVNGMAGRFITPYYILNIFAIPGLLWSFYSLYTDKMERRRILMFYVIATLMSLFSGTLLPIELMLFFLCPLLFLFHVFSTGVLFGLLEAVGIYLGFNNQNLNTLTALPGTLLEYLTYAQIHAMHETVLRVLIVGVIFFFIYFFMTRLYFKYLAVDLFHTGGLNRLTKGTIDAVGGIENIRMTHSSPRRLTLSLYDPSKLDVAKLKALGSFRVMETKAGFAITYGAASTMVRLGINKQMRENIREVEAL